MWGTVGVRNNMVMFSELTSCSLESLLFPDGKDLCLFYDLFLMEPFVEFKVASDSYGSLLDFLF